MQHGRDQELGHLVDLSHFVRDRIKDIIISGAGIKSSLEIEQVLYAHPDILECAVIAKQNERWGEIPKAVVAPRPGTELTAEQVLEFSREYMNHFKALQEAEVVQNLPRGGTGQIMKQQIKRLYD